MEQITLDQSVDYIERKEAAHLLNISMRTLDRYLKKNKIGSIKNGYRILVKRIDVDQFINEYKVDDINYQQNHNVTYKENRFSSHKNNEKDIMSTLSKVDNNQSMALFKNLFVQLNKELEKKDEKIELANYRIGQLETEIKQSIPLATQIKKDYEVQQVLKKAEIKINKLHEETVRLEKELHRGLINKKISVFLLTVLFLAAPLIAILNSIGVL
jgi:excisionase family DNA binding protein